MSETAMNYNYPPGASPAEIWAILREVAEGQKETRLQMQETDRQMQETDRKMQKTDRLIQENAKRMAEHDRQMKEYDQRMKESDRKFGELSNRFGELAEHLVAPSILEKFNAMGFCFEEMSPNRRITDGAGKRIAEIDILLENDNTVMVVEVKSKPREEDVEKHINRMEVLRRRANARKDTRTLLGAIAGAIMTDDARDSILANGFYVIEQTGDTVMINIPEDFKPRQW